MTHGPQARRMVRHFRSGVLATQSLKFPGYPYASALPFCTDQRGRIVVLISHLAEHTQNADHDRRASFLVAPSGAQVQEQARITLIGDLAPTEDTAVATRYLRYLPEGEGYLNIGGFRFFCLEPLSVRFIAGFGSIHTIPGKNYLAASLAIAEAESEILVHMNAEHAQNLRDYCRHVHQRTVESTQMIGIDCDGFDVLADAEVLRFDFDGEVKDADAARGELVNLAKASRV
ncbi:MAG: HugZ family pyridoxamine 5'-phosphate oxidase [Betaproteobacteria bacterium]